MGKELDFKSEDVSSNHTLSVWPGEVLNLSACCAKDTKK